MKIKIEIEVPDSFEKGDCDVCPFSYYDYEDYSNYCVLESDKCPISMEESKDE